ncbi:MAG: hypothetical protein EP338_07820 [Bacteroidetes bacterium]|nr:MAG: hypothetical protein EP338_07820 [Bacteroidota bacterium]
MRQVLYSEKDIELVKYLIGNTPLAIWYNFTSYFFTYPNFYIEIGIEQDVAVTQNQYDEILYGKIEKIGLEYLPSEHSELVCKEKQITKAYIMRTLLYFDTFRSYNRLEKIKNRLVYGIKTVITGRKDPFLKIWSQTTGVGAEYTCNPKSEQAKEAIPEYSNLVDTGVLFEIDGKYLKAYTEGNGFGFSVWDNKYLLDATDLEEITFYYEAIKIE